MQGYRELVGNLKKPHGEPDRGQRRATSFRLYPILNHAGAFGASCTLRRRLQPHAHPYRFWPRERVFPIRQQQLGGRTKLGFALGDRRRPCGCPLPPDELGSRLDRNETLTFAGKDGSRIAFTCSRRSCRWSGNRGRARVEIYAPLLRIRFAVFGALVLSLLIAVGSAYLSSGSLWVRWRPSRRGLTPSRGGSGNTGCAIAR